MNLITIDGPSASGKGTVSQQLAEHLNWEVLDSGALYRLSAYALKKASLDPEDEKVVSQMISSLLIRFEQGKIWLNHEEVSDQLRHEEIGALASKIAKYPLVRQALLQRQRDFFYTAKGLVADGRDMGTVVFPQAPLKIFLNAEVGERAKRRYEQLKSKGIPAEFSLILEDLKKRDDQDMNRPIAPLKPAKDAIIIDSSHLSVSEVVQKILLHWKNLDGFDKTHEYQPLG